MNSNLETASQGELALTDWLRLAGLLIFVVLICFSVVLFCKGAIHPLANQTEALVHSFAPTAGLELRRESNPEEAHSQSVRAVTASETRLGSTTSLSNAPTVPIQQPQHRSASEGTTIFNAKRAHAIRGHPAYSAKRPASRQGSTLDEVVFKSVNVLVGMWRHTWETSKVHGRRTATRSNPSP
jgi:hypothetical protein